MPARWSTRVTAIVLAIAGAGAALTSDWFVTALTPAIHTLHMSEEFAGLVIVAIAGNAVENVVGIQLAARNKMDFAVGVIVNSSLQIALALTPVLVILSLLFATHLTLVFPTLLAIVLLLSGIIGALIVNDGESTWEEGAVMVGFYVVIAAASGGGPEEPCPGDGPRDTATSDGDRLYRRARQFDEILRTQLDLQPAPAGADEDRLPDECALVDRRRQPLALAEGADPADDVAGRPFRRRSVGQLRALAGGPKVELSIGGHDEHAEAATHRRDERLEELARLTAKGARDRDGVVAVVRVDYRVLVQAELDPRPPRSLDRRRHPPSSSASRVSA